MCAPFKGDQMKMMKWYAGYLWELCVFCEKCFSLIAFNHFLCELHIHEDIKTCYCSLWCRFAPQIWEDMHQTTSSPGLSSQIWLSKSIPAFHWYLHLKHNQQRRLSSIKHFSFSLLKPFCWPNQWSITWSTTKHKCCKIHVVSGQNQ